MRLYFERASLPLTFSQKLLDGGKKIGYCFKSDRESFENSTNVHVLNRTAGLHECLSLFFLAPSVLHCAVSSRTKSSILVPFVERAGEVHGFMEPYNSAPGRISGRRNFLDGQETLRRQSLVQHFRRQSPQSVLQFWKRCLCQDHF